MTLKFNGFKAKRNFHTILNFVLFQKYEKYENKYRTKICDFIVQEQLEQQQQQMANFYTDMEFGMSGERAFCLVLGHLSYSYQKLGDCA